MIEKKSERRSLFYLLHLEPTLENFKTAVYCLMFQDIWYIRCLQTELKIVEVKLTFSNIMCACDKHAVHAVFQNLKTIFKRTKFKEVRFDL